MKKNLLLMCLTFVFAFMFFSCMNVDVNKVEYPKPNYSDSQKQELENYTNLIKENPNDAGAYSMRANLEKNCGDFVNSLNDYNKAIELDNTNYQYYKDRAVLKKDYLGNLIGAIKDWDKVIELCPN